MYPLIHPEFQLLVISGDWMWRSNFYIFEIFISKQYELWMDGWEMRTIKFHFGCGDGDALQYRNSGRDEDNDHIFLGLQLIGMKNSFFFLMVGGWRFDWFVFFFLLHSISNAKWMMIHITITTGGSLFRWFCFDVADYRLKNLLFIHIPWIWMNGNRIIYIYESFWSDEMIIIK